MPTAFLCLLRSVPTHSHGLLPFASDCAVAATAAATVDHKRLSLGNRKNINSLRNVHVSIIKRNVCDVYYVRFHFAFGGVLFLSAGQYIFLPLLLLVVVVGLEPTNCE